MRKFFLSFLALTMSMSASAFYLRMQQKDVVKEISDDSQNYLDLFNNGAVDVLFYGSTVHVILHEASLFATTDNPGIPFVFQNGNLSIELKGDYNHIYQRDDWNSNPIMALHNCNVEVISSSRDTYLSLQNEGDGVGIEMTGNTTLNIGNIRKDAFSFSINTIDRPCIKGATSGKQVLNVYSVSVGLSTVDKHSGLGDVPTLYLDEINLKYNQPLKYPIRLNGAEFWVWNKELDMFDEPYKGNMGIPAPYAIFFGDEPMFEKDADEFEPSSLVEEFGKKGKISYDEASNTLTLEDAIIDGFLLIDYDNFTLNLKGDNYFRNSDNNTTTRIIFYGKNVTITGEEDAELTVKGASKSDGIYAAGGLKLADFKKLVTVDALNGIVGNKNATAAENVLHTNAELSLTAKNKAIKDFSNFTYALGMNYGISPDEDYVSLIYQILLKFYDVEVTAKNADDIVIPGADGKASYDHATATLTLENFKNDMTIPSTAIYAFNDMTIQLIGTNKMESSASTIYTDDNLTIEGNGTLELISSTENGIYIPEEGVLTIQNGAEVEATGERGIRADANVYCEDEEPKGKAATLNIINATLKATSTQLSDDSHGAILGFKTINTTGAKITEPATAALAFKCDGLNAFAGIMDGDAYAQSVTISKTGGSAIDQINEKMEKCENAKILKDGQLFIQYGDKTYNAQGAEVK